MSTLISLDQLGIDESFNYIKDDLKTGDTLYFQSRYFEAHKIYESILEQISESTTEDKTRVLMALYLRAGLSATKIGRYSDSNNVLMKALDLIEPLKKELPLQEAVVCHAVGKNFQKDAKYSEAEELYQCAVGIIKESYGEDHVELGIVYNKLAHVKENLRKDQDALDYLERAEKINLQHNREELATTYFRYANVYWTKDDSEKAIDYIEKSLILRQQIYGEDHADIAMCYNVLGNLQQGENGASQALEYFNKGLKMLQSLVGTDYPDVAYFYYDLGSLYYNKEEYDEALANYKKALEIEEKFLPEDHPNIAWIHKGIGNTYARQEKNKESLDYYSKALAILDERCEENSSAVIGCLESIIEIYKKEEQYPDARKLVKKKLALQVKEFGERSPEVAESYSELADLFISEGQGDKAIKKLMISLKINHFLKNRPPNIISTDFFTCGFLLNVVHDIDTTQAFYRKAISAFEKEHGRNADPLLEVYRLLMENEQKKALVEKDMNFTV